MISKTSKNRYIFMDTVKKIINWKEKLFSVKHMVDLKHVLSIVSKP